ELIGGNDEVSRGIVDQKVDGADFGGHGLHRLGLSNVDEVKLGAAAGCPDLLHRRPQVLLFAAGQNHRGAETGQLASDAESNSGASAGDDAHAVPEAFLGKHPRIICNPPPRVPFASIVDNITLSGKTAIRSAFAEAVSS